jgi:hypothetical protein
LIKYLKNTKTTFFLAIIFFLTPLNTIAEDTTPATTTLASESKVNPNYNPDTTTTTSSLSTPTKAENIYICPVAFVLGGDQKQQTLIKEFRDEVLAKHEKGITYTKLYYINSPEITLIILSNKDIRAYTKKILVELIPVAIARLDKGKAELSQQLIDDIDTLLNTIAHKATSKLREVIKMAKSDLIKKEIFKELGIKITK